MKREVLIGGLVSLAISCVTQIKAQEIGLSAGVQVIRGELTEYDIAPTLITSVSAFWDIPEAPNWRYGAEFRYASMQISPDIEEGWLSNYHAQGNDFSVMASIRYYFNRPRNFHQRKRSLLLWTHFGVGIHAQSYYSINTGTGVKSGQLNKMGQLIERQTNTARALELGFGAQYYIDDHWSILFTAGAQYTGNDYLDGISGIGDGED